jgi:Leucine carboxyl methyltransferase
VLTLNCAGLAGTRHPLKAASYVSLAADLREAGWTRGLQAQGFDPSVPTVWLAEVTPRTRIGLRYERWHLCTHHSVAEQSVSV